MAPGNFLLSLNSLKVPDGRPKPLDPGWFVPAMLKCFIIATIYPETQK